MNFMFFRDVILLGASETFMMILIGLTLGCGRKAVFRIEFLHLKLFFSMTAILGGVFFIRENLETVFSIAMFSMTLYVLNFKFIFNINLRKSLIVGSACMMILLFSEMLILPCMSVFSNQELMYLRFRTTIIVRFIQIIILGLMMINNVCIGSLNVINQRWRELKGREKTNTVVVIMLMISCIAFKSSYSDLYIKLSTNHWAMEKPASVNLNMYFFESVFIFLTVVYLLKRTRNYYVYEEFLSRGDKEILFDILEMAEIDEMKEYKRIVDLYLKESMEEAVREREDLEHGL